MSVTICKTNKKRAVRGSVASPMLKSDSPLARKIVTFLFQFRISYLIFCVDLLLLERKGIRNPWKVDDFLPNQKEKVAYISRVETSSSV